MTQLQGTELSSLACNTSLMQGRETPENSPSDRPSHLTFRGVRTSVGVEIFLTGVQAACWGCAGTCGCKSIIHCPRPEAPSKQTAEPGTNPVHTAGLWATFSLVQSVRSSLARRNARRLLGMIFPVLSNSSAEAVPADAGSSWTRTQP